MRPRDRAALLWGVVGALAFLALIQGYELLTDTGVDALVKAAVALVVGITAAVTTRLLQGRLGVA